MIIIHRQCTVYLPGSSIVEDGMRGSLGKVRTYKKLMSFDGK